MAHYEIRKNIYWVGAIDWNLRNFHGYSTSSGSTYNAYLIIDDKIALIDTVKEPFSQELIKNISEIIDPSKIDIIISNHVEPDHSGALPNVLKYCPNAEVYTSFPSGEKGLKMHYGENMNLKPMKSGESISLGSKTLSFVQTPMVHWPDNMVTYMAEDKILFSNDAFGQHIASSERMDYESDLDLVYREAKKYYANIVMPYGAQVKKAIDVIAKLDIDVIAPSHGIIWEKYIPQILEFYNKAVNSVKKDKAVVVYDTMWGNTATMAKTIAEFFAVKGLHVKLMNLQANHISDIITEIMNSKILAVGSSTINNNILPTVASFLCYLKGLKPSNLRYICFGSYGWGGQAAAIIEKDLQSLGYTQLCENLRIQFKPNYQQLAEMQLTLEKGYNKSNIKLLKEKQK